MSNGKQEITEKFKYKLTLLDREFEKQYQSMIEEAKSGEVPKDKIVYRIGNLQKRLNDITVCIVENLK